MFCSSYQLISILTPLARRVTLSQTEHVLRVKRQLLIRFTLKANAN